MQKIDLLPCPFCGRKPKISELNIQLHQISCLFSKCPAHPCVIKGTMEEAAKAWNTRASGWIPCSERLPEDGLNVLVYDSYGNEQLIAWYDKKKEIGWHESTADFPLHDISDWMPLPKAPKGKDDAE